jgi:hypothetical protein
MKHDIRRFKDLKVALLELQQFILNGASLQTGRPIRNFGRLLPREILANWLICAAVNFDRGNEDIFLATDPFGGDGLICEGQDGDVWPTEHVFVPALDGASNSDAGEQILEKIRSKNSRGKAYASGKTLVVFVNAGDGHWHPNKLSKSLPDPFYFNSAWAVALQGIEAGQYIYGVTKLDLSLGEAPIWRIRISDQFDSWDVERTQ